MALRLLHPPERIVAQALHDLNIGKLVGTSPAGDWPITVNMDSDTPDSLLSVYGTNALGHHRNQITGEEIREEGILIRIRAARPDTCGLKAWAVAYYLAQTLYDLDVTINEQPLSSTVYRIRSMRSTSGPVPISPRNKPVSGRTIYVINYLVSFVEVQETGGG